MRKDSNLRKVSTLIILFFLIGVAFFPTIIGFSPIMEYSNNRKTSFILNNYNVRNSFFIDENITLTDSGGDVYDLLNGGYVYDHPRIEVENIDIIRLMYNHSEKNASLTLEVNGTIENRGNISDLGGMELKLDMVIYEFYLHTTTSEYICEYLITYVNNSCQLKINNSEPINLTSDKFYVDNNTLTIFFELNKISEIYGHLQARADYIYIDLGNPDDDSVFLVDFVPNPPLEVIASAPNIGIPTQPIQFNGSALFGKPPYSYHWDFGDGKTSNEKGPIHTYNKPGNYKYILTVTDDSDSDANFSDYIEILKPTFIVGKITNKTKTEKITTFEVINIRYIQYSPLMFFHFKDGEKIQIYGKLIGIISKRFVCGFFYSTVIYSRYNYSMNIFSRDDLKNTIVWLVSGVEGQLIETENIETFLENESGYPQQDANVTFNEVTGYGYVNPGDTFTVVAPSDGDYRFILYHKTQGYDLFISSLTHY